MPRWFNTAGPCRPEHHYMLPATRRVPEVRRLIEQEGYFVVHAPRQVGKTTALLSLARELTSEGRYAAVLVSMEVGSAFTDDIGAAETALLDDWKDAAEMQLPAELRPPPFSEAPPGRRVGAALSAWARASPRPLIVFLAHRRHRPALRAGSAHTSFRARPRAAMARQCPGQGGR